MTALGVCRPSLVLMGSDRMPDINDPATIRDASFATSFRGFDKLEVRAFLHTLARRLDEVDESQTVAETGDQEGGSEVDDAPEPEDDPRAEQLGARAWVVLESANEAAAERLRVAEQEASELRGRADADALSIMRSAEEAAGVMLVELESKNTELSKLLKSEQSVRDRERADELAAAQADADEIRAAARSEGSEIVAKSVSEGREMVAEARLVRERILRDLSRRRTNSKVQLEQLKAGRERLLEAIELTSSSVTDVHRDLEASLPEARLAAESAGRTVPPPVTVEQLESEIESARLVGHPIVEPAEVDAVVSNWGDGDLGDEPNAEKEIDGDLLDLVGDDGDLERSEEIFLAEIGDENPGGLFRRKKTLPPEAAELPNESVPTVEAAADFEEVRIVDPTLELAVVDGTIINFPDETPDVEEAIEPHLEESDELIVELAAEEVKPSETPGSAVDEEILEIASEGDETPIEDGNAEDEADEGESVETVELVVDAAIDLVDVTETPEEQDSQESSVDDLFERLRADREARVAQASEVLDTSVEASGPQRTDEPATASGAIDTLVRAEVETEPSDRLQQAELALAERRSMLDSLERMAARKLKRTLADEQNELLDLVRRSDTAEISIDDVAGDLCAHSRAYVDAIALELSEAANAGAKSVGGDTVAFDPVATATLVGDQLVSVLRLRCDQAIGDSGTSDDAIDHLRSIYRETRSQRIGSIASNLVVSAYGDGAYACLSPSEPVRWELAPDSDCGQHCTDNVVGGAVLAGEQFPSGHLMPPATPECRCFLVRER